MKIVILHNCSGIYKTWTEYYFGESDNMLRMRSLATNDSINKHSYLIDSANVAIILKMKITIYMYFN